MEDEVQMLMIRLAKFLKLYKDDIKIIFSFYFIPSSLIISEFGLHSLYTICSFCMNFPTNLLSQEKRLTKKMQETNDPVRKKWLQR